MVQERTKDRRTAIARMKPGHREQAEVLKLLVGELERARVLVLKFTGGAIGAIAAKLAKAVEKNACQACISRLKY